MVTRERARLARRALECLALQTWRDLELVVVDDGVEDYAPLLDEYRAHFAINYVRLAPKPGRKLGGLRNIGLDAARGELVAQWDDDEWYHPQRLEVQARALVDARATAVVLDWTLMHVDAPGLAQRAFRGACWGGTPGTIVHRRSPVRYPNLARAEDTKYARALARHGTFHRLDRRWSHLFIRCFHGANTWSESHFVARLRRTPLDWVRYLRARWIDGDLTRHPAFALEPREAGALAAFLDDSRRLGLIEA
jgi:glycosyltransferase involved in cell wall biosynthesis